MAQGLGEYFIDKIANIKSSIEKSPVSPFEKLRQGVQIVDGFDFRPVGVWEVIKTIESLKNSTSIGIYGICTRTVKIAKDIIAEPLRPY